MSDTDKLAANQAAALAKAQSLKTAVRELSESNGALEASNRTLRNALENAGLEAGRLAIVEKALADSTAELKRSNGLLQELQDALLSDDAPPVSEPDTAPPVETQPETGDTTPPADGAAPETGESSPPVSSAE